jgi:hypothetical protein
MLLCFDAAEVRPRRADRESSELAGPLYCLGDDVVAGRQAQPGALASLLGGEERLE